MDPISAGLGAVSLISGKNAQKKAQKDANNAAKGSKALEQRAIKLWDVLFNRAQDAQNNGTFDPEKRIAALEEDTARYESRDLGNLAGALSIAGAKPGDSEVNTRLDAVKIKYRKFLDNMREEIRQKSFWEQNQAYQAANPAYLQPAMQGSQNRQMIAQGQADAMNPAGFLANLLPSITKPKSSGFSMSGGAPVFASMFGA